MNKYGWYLSQSMIKRSRELFEAGYYLSRFTRQQKRTGKLLPPAQLQTDQWRDAYRMFYPKLSGGRTLEVFIHSLKNTRDNYDSYTDTGRIGWREQTILNSTSDRKPRPLSSLAANVFMEFQELSEDKIWKIISQYASSDLRVIDSDWVHVVETELEQQQGLHFQVSRTEGGLKVIQSLQAERCGELPKKAKEIHGYRCQICGFDFERMYGDWGHAYIHVHHLQPLGDGAVRDTDPAKDLSVVCANCHAMIHRKRGITLTVAELQRLMKQAQMMSDTYSGPSNH